MKQATLVKTKNQWQLNSIDGVIFSDWHLLKVIDYASKHGYYVETGPKVLGLIVEMMNND